MQAVKQNSGKKFNKITQIIKFGHSENFDCMYLKH